MGVASIVLGVLALLFAVGGFALSFIPVVGSLLSFGAPVLALIGIVLGGVGVSRARDEGGDGGIALAGLIVSIVAFFPSFFVAITCGLCNAACTTAAIGRRASGAPPFWLVDAGALGPFDPMDDPDFDPLDDPDLDPQRDPAQPPPAFPPPPLDPPAADPAAPAAAEPAAP
ncbi:MAG TPA: hypothetical protein VIL20_12985 [Sandaracinaceae bacterium]